MIADDVDMFLMNALHGQMKMLKFIRNGSAGQYYLDYFRCNFHFHHVIPFPIQHLEPGIIAFASFGKKIDNSCKY